MRNIRDWFNEYGQSHQNKINKLIHWICIPLIFWSIISLLSIIPHDYLKLFPQDSIFNEFMHWGTIVILLGLLFYLRLSFRIFIGMLLYSVFVLWHIYYTVYRFNIDQYWGMLKDLKLEGSEFLLYLSLFLFMFAWILQFIGHKIEGKKPSFLKDIQFLLIGPAWLLGFIYDSFNIKY